MAIALDTSVDNGTRNGATSVSWDHTCTGSNLVLIVSIITNNSVTVNSATYNGVAMTQADSALSADTSVSRLFYLIGPSTGTNTISFSFSGTSLRLGMSASYTGVGSVDVVTKQVNDTDGTMVNTLVTLAANAWTVLAANDYGNTGGSGTANLAAGTGSTVRQSNTTSGDQNYVGIFDSNGPIVSPGSTSMTVTGNTGGATHGLGGVMVSLAPVPPSAIKTWNGLAVASVKTVNGLAKASVKTINGLQ